MDNNSSRRCNKCQSWKPTMGSPLMDVDRNGLTRDKEHIGTFIHLPADSAFY